MVILTTQDRQTNAKKALTGTALVVALLTGGTATDYYLIADVQLAGEKFTPYEYGQLKTSLIARVNERKTKLLSYREAGFWQATWNRENEKCKFVMTEVTEENVVDKANDALSKGC